MYIELVLHFGSRESIDVDNITNEHDVDLDDVNGFDIDTEYYDLDKLFERVLDVSLFSSDKVIVETLQETVSELRSFTEEDAMKLLAYETEYTVTSFEEISIISLSSIEVLGGFASPSEYLREITLEDNPELQVMADCIDWDAYANYIGLAWQSLTLDSDPFIYILT